MLAPGVEQGASSGESVKVTLKASMAEGLVRLICTGTVTQVWAGVMQPEAARGATVLVSAAAVALVRTSARAASAVSQARERQTRSSRIRTAPPRRLRRRVRPDLRACGHD
jgi:hypothetical protein